MSDNNNKDILDFFSKSTSPDGRSDSPGGAASFTLENGTEKATLPWRPGMTVAQAFKNSAQELSFDPTRASIVYRCKGQLVAASQEIAPNATYTASATAESKG